MNEIGLLNKLEKTIEDKDTRLWPLSINTREVKK